MDYILYAYTYISFILCIYIKYRCLYFNTYTFIYVRVYFNYNGVVPYYTVCGALIIYNDFTKKVITIPTCPNSLPYFSQYSLSPSKGSWCAC